MNGKERKVPSACARAEQAGKRREKKEHFDAHAQKEKERMLPAEDAAYVHGGTQIPTPGRALSSNPSAPACLDKNTHKETSKRSSASLLDVLGREQALEPSKCTKTSHLNNQFLHTISAVRTNINLIFKLQLYSACFCCLVEKTSTNKFAHYTGGALGRQIERHKTNQVQMALWALSPSLPPPGA